MLAGEVRRLLEGVYVLRLRRSRPILSVLPGDQSRRWRRGGPVASGATNYYDILMSYLRMFLKSERYRWNLQKDDNDNFRYEGTVDAARERRRLA